MQSAAVLAAAPARSAPGRVFAWAGSSGAGIVLLEMDPATGALTERERFTARDNPSWLALDATRRTLYAANESASTVSAWAVDAATGRLTPLNTVSSGGDGPAHLSLHPAGGHVLVANYGGGTVAVLPVDSGGRLGEATDVQKGEGTVGPKRATSAPPGSLAISGHESAHAHMVQADPSGRFVLAADLGLDRILVWRFDAARGKLTPADPPSVALPPGDGPRHFAFHPNGRRLYSLQEEASTIVTFDYDDASGRLRQRQSISSLPAGFAGTNFTSEIAVGPGARFVYAANRLHDSVAWFGIDGDGALAFAGEEWTRGDYPRHFAFDPTGAYLYTSNQHGDAIAAFRADRATGALTFTGQYTPVAGVEMLLF